MQEITEALIKPLRVKAAAERDSIEAADVPCKGLRRQARVIQ